MFYGRLIGSIILFVIGSWYVVTQEAQFTHGGNPSLERKGTYVNAQGLDAVVIGSFIIGLGFVNIALSEGIQRRIRLTAFWIGTVLFILSVCYWIGFFALDIYQFYKQVCT